MSITAIEKESIIDAFNYLDKSPGIYAVWKRPISKGHILCEYIYIAFEMVKII